MKLIIFINGPIESGKDTLGELLADTLNNHGFAAKTAMFKEELYLLAAQIASVPVADFIRQATNRELKEAPWFVLPKNFVEGTSSFGTYFSPRDWLIHISERVVKPLLGKHYFGASSLKNVVHPFFSTGGEVIIYTDTGFIDEYNEVVQGCSGIYGFKHRLIHLHRNGTGFNPAKDSRGYVGTPDFIVHNNHDLRSLQLMAEMVLDEAIYNQIKRSNPVVLGVASE